MGLDYAIPPALKRGNLQQARIFAIVAASFGTLLFIVALLTIFAKIGRSAKKQKETQRILSQPPEEVIEEKSEE
jgi:hypothetical protein